MATSHKITKAFRALRRDGYFARQNWMCCTSCGAANAPEDQPFVFYHCQDADMLKETGQVYLAWAGDGHHIVERMTKAGLQVIWNGDDAVKILVSERGLQ